MAKGKIKQKKSRKELVKEEDAFINAAGQSAEWMHDNKRAVTSLGVAFVLVVSGVIGFTEWRRHANAAGSTLFARAEILLDAEVIEPAMGAPSSSEDGAAEASQADPEATPPTFPSVEARDQAALSTFQEVLDTNADSGLKNMAGLYIGRLQEKSGASEAAEATFARVVADVSPADELYFVAVERLAYLQENRGEADLALKTLATLQQTPDSFYNDYATFHRARLLQSKGEVDKARLLYEGIEEKHPESSLLPEVKERLVKIGRSAKQAGGEDDGSAEASK